MHPSTLPQLVSDYGLIQLNTAPSDIIDVYYHTLGDRVIAGVRRDCVELYIHNLTSTLICIYDYLSKLQINTEMHWFTIRNHDEYLPPHSVSKVLLYLTRPALSTRVEHIGMELVLIDEQRSVTGERELSISIPTQEIEINSSN